MKKYLLFMRNGLGDWIDGVDLDDIDVLKQLVKDAIQLGIGKKNIKVYKEMEIK